MFVNFHIQPSKTHLVLCDGKAKFMRNVYRKYRHEAASFSELVNAMVLLKPILCKFTQGLATLLKPFTDTVGDHL